ncbi:L,D-transpeptidase family protein [Palleronia sp. KMU-117]|uniref:L,D-transpeptidase family protein n=1 Tax=Palleronia sp. KMU-117 TaxID=3434108 RepID=UPI003D716FB0
MSYSLLRRVALAAAMAALAACASFEPVSRQDGTASRPPSEFQTRLDALGIPLDLPEGRAILVNVPAFELIAFEDGTPVFRSRIIVGTRWNPTPLIDTYVSRVTFRPSWRPTPAMVASGEYRDEVRPPGRDNPLGLLAVRLEPGLLVYLHDTNQRQLFERDMRALSHGCIRVQRWDTLAAWVLGREESWVRTMAETPPSKDVPAPPIPVLIRYLPVFPAEDGTVLRHPDIYGLAAGSGAPRVSGKDASAACGGP